MRGNAGLSHAQNFLQLRNGELLLTQEQEEAQAGVIGEEPERFED
jgi:hypothetical protein